MTLMKRLYAFLLGMREFRSCVTWADPARTSDSDYTVLDRAYDHGRDFAHVITLRKWEE